ncbi:MAG: 30S ribosomal protein S20 [Candidatus Ryanbacteria bacterium CG10_big_fil_rev_8_21_14_0_10_43_42]|uniref:Small ribosomal subunit protein bS20 n=1 Tax=Candidatus Ryanbacteria bacterium CG10_big_fil_rev_8_21_14_0_10_43_42 TaxID=1974864 RepID=A0A2M8KWC2_9BACT|nr:MAG: 30S ribosomal protein S20 [Candidatus Ryanbacteria bacterium CG10_big_fil_rev_8_21_14_0_10_43_42]
MPNIKSQIKDLRQSEKRRIQNLKKTRAFRDTAKDIKKLVEAGKKEEAVVLLPKAYKAIDKAAKTNVLKKNTASRKKSYLAKLIQKGS